MYKLRCRLSITEVSMETNNTYCIMMIMHSAYILIRWVHCAALYCTKPYFIVIMLNSSISKCWQKQSSLLWQTVSWRYCSVAKL